MKPIYRPDPYQQAIRVGVPKGVKSTWYARLREGSWMQLFFWSGFWFLLLNLLFGILFYLQKGSISSVTENRFLDCLSFSVQTFSTIGYGSLSPATPYADFLVTLEAFVGIVYAAIVTGIIFSKASAPKSSIIFSNVMVIGRHRDMPVLAFRLGNATGSQIVSAEMKLTALIERKLKDGSTFRDLVNLKILRDQTPLFLMTWTVFHPLDEFSPLRGLLEDEEVPELIVIIAAVEGHDKSYSLAVHDRKLYYPESFRFKAKFFDVISTLDSGVLQLDITQF